MKKMKWWKRWAALAISVSLLTPGQMAFAMEGEPNVQMKGADTDFSINDEGELTRYTGDEADVVIPETVTGIGEGVFRECENLKSVAISKNVRYIGEFAFEDCTNLTRITIPEATTRIYDGAFSGCSNLSEINIDEKNQCYTSEGGCLYYLCDEKKEIAAWPGAKGNLTLPETVDDIRAYAFSGSSLSGITLPEGLKNLKEGTFSGCSSLSSVTLPKNIENIGRRAFFCSSLSSITLPEGLTEIGEGTFSNCDNLSNITLPESLRNIGAGAFEYSGITSLTIPGNVENMGEELCQGCNSLKNVTLAEGVTAIPDWSFYKCGSLSSVSIPSSVKSIGEWAFYVCAGLNSIALPEGLTEIKMGAFAACSGLKENITIPGSVTNIGENAFAACKNLKSITILEGVANIESYAFSECDNLRGAAIPASVTNIGELIFERCKNPAIYGKEGSYAQTYAVQNGIPFFTGEMPVFPDTDPVPDPTPNPDPVPNPNPAPAPQPGQKKAVSSCDIKLSALSYTYDGKEKRPAVTVKDGTKTLTLNTDYTVSYSNNVKVGTAKAIITGKGNYTGTAERKFTIKKAEKGTQTINCKKSYDKTYGDKPFKLNAKVTKGNGRLTYKSSNKKTASVDSKGKITIKGTGIAEITVKAAATSTYKEKSVKVTIKVKPVKQTVKSLKVMNKKRLQVSWKKDKNAAGYEIQYSTDKKFKNKKVTKTVRVNNSKTTSKTLTKLTKGKKYYVKVRAFQKVKVKGKSQKLYGNWSSVKKSKGIRK